MLLLSHARLQGVVMDKCTFLVLVLGAAVT